MKYILIAFATIALSLTSCSSNKNSNDTVDEPVAESSIDMSDFKSVMSVPDSLCSPEQLELKTKLIEVCQYVRIVDNRMELTVGEEYFQEHGIPVEEYYEMVNTLKRNNEDFAKMEAEGHPFSNLAEKWEEAKKEYGEYLEEYYKTGITITDFYEHKRNE